MLRHILHRREVFTFDMLTINLSQSDGTQPLPKCNNLEIDILFEYNRTIYVVRVVYALSNHERPPFILRKHNYL